MEEKLSVLCDHKGTGHVRCLQDPFFSLYGTVCSKLSHLLLYECKIVVALSTEVYVFASTKFMERERVYIVRSPAPDCLKFSVSRRFVICYRHRGSVIR